MGYRTVRDSDGTEWQIWEVKPVWTERRATDRRSPDSASLPPGEERRTSTERRTGYDPARPRISPGLELGWLAFASPTERRRIAPAPDGWEEMPDEKLIGLCRSAAPCPPRPERSLGREA